MPKIKVFDYIPQLDCFIVRRQFKELMEKLGLAEWTPVVWIGRLFILDNDYGEHIFDNWDEREERIKKAKKLGIDVGFGEEELMIVVPSRFAGHGPHCMKCREEIRGEAACSKCGGKIFVGPDGPCHSDEQRKRFWTDVFNSLELDYETIFAEARDNNEFVESSVAEYGEGIRKVLPIEEIIAEIKASYNRAVGESFDSLY